MSELYIDASDHVVGRLASNVAKALLKGDKVFVVNAEKAVVSGGKDNVKDHYIQKVQRGDPYHGPFYPKTPDRLIKRVVRGMIPKKPRGKIALKNLMVYISVPEELSKKKFQKIKTAENKLECSYTELGKLCNLVSGIKY